MSSAVPDIYSFFSDFKIYMQYDSYIEKNSGTGEHNNTCDAFMIDFQISNTESANQICAKFKNFYKFIISTKNPPKNKSLDKNDFAYLNYWINRKLRNTKISNELTVKEFHEKLNNHDNDFVGYDMFAGKLFDIGENDFQNMKLLDYLHSNYFENFTEISTLTKEKNVSCFKHVKELLNTYKRGIIQCHIDDTNFCKALKFFTRAYDNIFFGKDSITEKCTDQKLLKLPTYEDVSLEEKNISVVGSILGSSFGTLFTMLILYKVIKISFIIINVF
ncbi:hypothetical protein POWCR01_130005100 [Plasmodium ovale]|uniref:PIR protein n=1 Tax=Plasmodium ovale TaxID=36330 RepID=A0A1C3KWJ2_PLAOA|nr:hypothetical protein POWCR01_130005100 [Plasmodium ovale]